MVSFSVESRRQEGVSIGIDRARELIDRGAGRCCALVRRDCTKIGLHVRSILFLR